jgi:hypothetical protein
MKKMRSEPRLEGGEEVIMRLEPCSRPLPEELEICMGHYIWGLRHILSI